MYSLTPSYNELIALLVAAGVTCFRRESVPYILFRVFVYCFAVYMLCIVVNRSIFILLPLDTILDYGVGLLSGIYDSLVLLFVAVVAAYAQERTLNPRRWDLDSAVLPAVAFSWFLVVLLTGAQARWGAA